MITVRYFGGAAEAAGVESEQCAPAGRLDELTAALADAHPDLERVLPVCSFLVDEASATADTPLGDTERCRPSSRPVARRRAGSSRRPRTRASREAPRAVPVVPGAHAVSGAPSAEVSVSVAMALRGWGRRRRRRR